MRPKPTLLAPLVIVPSLIPSLFNGVVYIFSAYSISLHKTFTKILNNISSEKNKGGIILPKGKII